MKGEIQLKANSDVNTEHIAIEFKYKILGSEQWHLREISVDEYFDFSMLDEGEILEVDCIPMYDDLIDYFEDKDRKIRQIFICLTDKIKNKKLQFTKTLWNNQNNTVVERIDSIDGVISYHEFIITTLLPTEVTGNDEKDYEILRFSPKEDSIECWYHGFIHDNADGSQSEIRPAL